MGVLILEAARLSIIVTALLSNYLTVDGRPCPPVASVLGIDILIKFDISASDDLERRNSN